MNDTNECACESCQRACTHKPGWFLPGEAERAAELLGMELPAFFQQYLGVDWWQGDSNEGDIFLLTPAVTSMSAGTQYPFDPMGRCVFFEHGRCAIHAAKPFECRALTHDDSQSTTTKRHEETALAWQTHQGQIEELLGYAPETPEASLSALFSMFSLFR